MPLSYEQYKRKQALLADPDKEFSDEARSAAQAAIEQYESEFLSKGKYADEKPLAPGEGLRVLPTKEDPLVSNLMRSLDPTHPLQPQALAVQPATTHPAGDQAAKDEWLRGDLANPAGRVIVYEAPVAQARKELLENPQLFKALGFGIPSTPDEVVAMQAGGALHQAYNDYKWRETADAAAQSGKTAYRFSKAPYLSDGKGASTLDTLSTKLGYGVGPAMDAARAYVMGYDQTASFGAATALSNSGLLDPSEESKKLMAGPRRESKDEIVGGIPASGAVSNRERNDMVAEEHPAAQTAGQIYGAAPGLIQGAAKGAARLVAGDAGEAAVGAGIKAIPHWNPANSLWEFITGAGAQQAERGVVGTVASSVAKNAVAGGVNQAVTEAAQAGANLAATGETGTTLADAGERVLDATKSAGVTGGVLEGGAKVIGKGVRGGALFEGLPGRVEKLGSEPRLGTGHVDPPAVAAARKEAKGREFESKPIDVLAEQIDKPLTDAAKGHEGDVRRAVGERTAEVKASPEGRQKLPAAKTLATALDQLRERKAPIGRGAPTAVGVPNADRPVKGIFNSNIEAVSIEPREGWLPVSAKEADSYFSSFWQRHTLKAVSSKKPSGRTPVAANLATVPEAGPMVGKPQRAAAGGIERAPEAGGLAREEKALVPVDRYREPRARQLASGEEGIQRGSREPPAARATATQQATAREVPGARWKRREQPEGPTPPTKSARAPRASKEQPGTFAEELRKRGVKTVYVAPRRYNAMHHETVIRQLRRKGADTPNDRDLGDIYHAALEDRDARSWRGEKGGWSKLQQENEAALRAAKDTRRLAAPKGGSAYQQVVGIGQQAPGQSKTVKALAETAHRAGGDTLEKLRGARVIAPLDELRARSHFGKYSVLNPRSHIDAAVLRGIYPITHALERGVPGRLSGVHEDEQAGERRKERDKGHAAGYGDRAQEARGDSGKKRVRKERTRKVRKPREREESDAR